MTKTPRLMDNNINWEERRFLAASIILAGMCSNYAHPFTCRYEAEDAVKLADTMISVLTGININNVAELYQNPQNQEPQVSE